MDKPSALTVQLLKMADNNNPLGFSSQTDWSKCCLYQTDKKEELKALPTRYECNPQVVGIIWLQEMYHFLRTLTRCQ